MEVNLVKFSLRLNDNEKFWQARFIKNFLVF